MYEMLSGIEYVEVDCGCVIIPGMEISENQTKTKNCIYTEDKIGFKSYLGLSVSVSKSTSLQAWSIV